MGNMRLFLRPGEKLYLNGAVFRVDRKVSIELLNDATFLLENHVLQAEDATTPLKQIYFIVQMMLMDPANTSEPMGLFNSFVASFKQTSKDEDLLEGIALVEQDVESGKTFGALKMLRQLFEIEERILAAETRPGAAHAEPASSTAANSAPGWDMTMAHAKQIGA